MEKIVTGEVHLTYWLVEAEIIQAETSKTSWGQGEEEKEEGNR
jgi:hypothetical protein